MEMRFSFHMQEISEIDSQSGSLQAELVQHKRDEKSLLEGAQEARQIQQRTSHVAKALV